MKIRVNKPQNDFTIVPNYVTQRSGLSADALGVLVWLMSHQDGFTLSSTQVRKRFRFGRHTWLRISKELRAADALDHGVFHTSGDSGKQLVYGSALFVQWPEPIVCEGQKKRGVSKIDTVSKTDTPPVITPCRKSTHPQSENRHHTVPETRPLNKRDIKKGARESEVALKSQWLSAATGLPFSEWKAQQSAD